MRNQMIKIDTISTYLRGFAITGVVLENYLSYIRVDSEYWEVLTAVKYIQYFGASLVHIFFFLSGYSLIKKYPSFDGLKIKQYAVNRLTMILIPYWVVVVATYLCINMLHSFKPTIFTDSFEINVLVSYLLFLRNFNESSWELNPALWFMQVLFGLYIVFPLLLYMLKNKKFVRMLCFTAFIAYSARCIYWIFGYNANRESSIFLFYLFEFSFGMAYAQIEELKKFEIKIRSVNILFCLVALGSYSISFLLKIIIYIGANLHEVFTYIGSVSIGIFSFQVLNVFKMDFFKRFFYSIGNAAFLIYLVHVPPIQHIIRPFLESYLNSSQSIIFVMVLFLAYFIVIVLFSIFLSKRLRVITMKIEKKLIEWGGRVSFKTP